MEQIGLLFVVAVLLFLRFLAGSSRTKRGGRPGKAKRRFRPVPSHRPQPGGHHPDESHLGDPTAQMKFISKVEFAPRRLLNKSEFRVFRDLEKIVGEKRAGFRLMAQTSLGEVIQTSRASGSQKDLDLAFRSINSKRLDFLVIDRFGMPVLAVEYQGAGHYQNNAFLRDAVKREAIRKAGLAFLEVPAQFDPDVVKEQVCAALRKHPERLSRQGRKT